MQKRGISLIVIIFILLFLAIGSGILKLPQGFKIRYYSVLFKVTKPEKNLKKLTQLHQATKARVQGAKGVTYTYKYTKEHRSLIEADSARCIACHGSMTQDGKNAKYPIHQKMLTAPMLDFACTDCHKQVDIRKRSPSHVTIKVDRSFCPVCHDPTAQPIPAELVQGAAWGQKNAPEMPTVMGSHGTDEESGKKWISMHPRVGMAIGIEQCRKCHIPNSELDFCRVCHLRGGFRPASHQAVYSEPINKIYPESPRTDVVDTKWKGFHFVLVREALAKLGVIVDSPQSLPLNEVQKLPCGACHILEDWCTRCHIKHNPNWLDPNVGHPAYVAKYGSKYCFRCHDALGTKCVTCHSYVGQLK